MKKPKKEPETYSVPARTARFSGGQAVEIPPIKLGMPPGQLGELRHAMKVLRFDTIDGQLVGAYVPENAVDVLLWTSNGPHPEHPADPPGYTMVAGEGEELPIVGVGLADSERALGFLVFKPDGNKLGFVLNRGQVEALRDYLTVQLDRLED